MLGNLSTFQIVLGLAGILFILYNNGGFTAIANFFGKNSQPAVDKPKEGSTITVVPVTPEPVVRPISAVVKEWEDLRDLCVKQGLTSTVKKLDDTFPTFLDLTKEPKNV